MLKKSLSRKSVVKIGDLVQGGLDEAERLRTEKALRDYCGQDTLALVRLLVKLLLLAQS